MQSDEHDPHRVDEDGLGRLPRRSRSVRGDRERYLQTTERHEDQEERQAYAFDVVPVTDHDRHDQRHSADYLNGEQGVRTVLRQRRKDADTRFV